MGNKYCNINGEEEQISEKGYTKIIKLSKSKVENVINNDKGLLRDIKIT